MPSLACSVVIATRDRPRQLRRSTASVLAQSTPPKELIIVDDCSACDVTAAISDLKREGVACRFERLSSQVGAAAARNVGASLASGGILMFLDDDDTWSSCKVETQIRLFEAHPEVGTVYTGMLAVDGTRDEKVLSASRNHFSGNAWPKILFRNFMGPTSAAAIRRELFDAVGGFDPALLALQDYDLWLRLCMRAPVLYDGAHNLRFCAISSNSERLSTNIHNYELAFRRLQEKYQAELDALSPCDRSRFRAQAKLLLTSKHLQQGHRGRAALLMLQAIALYPPTIARLWLHALGRWTPAVPPYRAP